MLSTMRRLEALDAEQRGRGLDAPERLCAVPPETGRLLAILVASAPDGNILELGTSGGYSTLWLSRAARLRKQKILSFERLPGKLAIARNTFTSAGITDLVDINEGDAREHLAGCRDVAFCFMDHAKEQYIECYEMLAPNLVRGGLLVADNIISHREQLAEFVDHVNADARVDAVVIPIGKGVLLARRT